MRNSKIKLIILTVSLLALALSLHANASTIAAASCSRADLASAISTATYGDTVTVPAGTCTWTSSLVIAKGITLTGAGSSQTIIQSGPVGGYLLIYTPDNTSVSTNARFEVSGFTLDMANTGDAGIWLNNTSAMPISQVLIHDNVLKNMNAGNKSLDPACLHVGENGDVYGVAYLNTFQDCKVVGENYGIMRFHGTPRLLTTAAPTTFIGKTTS